MLILNKYLCVLTILRICSCKHYTIWDKFKKKPEFPLTIIINDMKLTPEKEIISVAESYVALAYYKFKEGELVDISCERHGDGLLNMTYPDFDHPNTAPRIHETTNNNISTIGQKKLKSENSGDYLCYRTEYHNHYYVLQVYFLLDETDVEDGDPLMVIINDMKLTPEKKILSETAYDAVAYYKFNEGELVDILCEKHGGGLLNMTYPNFERVKNAPRRYEITNNNVSTIGQVRLTSKNSGDYITCRTEYHKDYAVLRVYFFLDDTDPKNDVLQIQVNGVTLSRGHIEELKIQESSHQNGTLLKQNIYFWYKAMEGEKINVRCEIKNGWNGSMMFRNRNFTATYENVNAYSLTTQVNNEYRFYCTYTNYEQIDISTDTSMELAKRNKYYGCLAIITIEYKGFYVTGLNEDNIINHHQETKYSSEIYYRYADGETLYLTCTKIYNPIGMLKWIFDDAIVNSSRIEENGIINAFTSFVLDDSDDNSTIKCIFYDSRDNTSISHEIIIRLLYKDEDSRWVWLTAAIIIILIMIAISLLISYKNKRTKKPNIVVNYVNIPNDGLGPDPCNTSQQVTETSETLIYSEPAYIPNFKVSRHNYAYEEDSLYQEMGDSVFDTIVARMELAQKRKAMEHHYMNLQKPENEYCNMHPFRRTLSNSIK